ncbi:MAG TPA: hypothetical protein VFZ00_26980 [Solirubrobacter sp.]|nr:hypothetical protein [Solirubrobacter sp.]
MAAPLPPAAAAERHDRKLRWSGYTWTVRSTTGRADPGNNRWGDSRWNAQVRRDGSLRLNIFKGKAVELIGPRTGYGRYRWVVETDVRKVDPFRVIAFHVRGTRGEQDIEFSRWGDPAQTSVGTWVSWRRRTRLAFEFFAVPGPPRYTVQITWRPKRTRYIVRDGRGRLVLDQTFASSPAGKHVSPRISYWIYPGHGSSRPRFTGKTVHPPVIVRDFSFSRLRR